jgi:hypothetical protein
MPDGLSGKLWLNDFDELAYRLQKHYAASRSGSAKSRDGPELGYIVQPAPVARLDFITPRSS